MKCLLDKFIYKYDSFYQLIDKTYVSVINIEEMLESTSIEQFEIDEPGNADDTTQDVSYTLMNATISKRGRGKEYILMEDFNLLTDAKQFIASNYNAIRSSDNTIYYKCKGRQCPMRAYIRINSTNANAAIFVTDDEHVHSGELSRGLNIEIRDEIERLNDSGITLPNGIITNLKKRNLDIDKTKLKNFLSRLKKKKDRLVKCYNNW